MKHHRWHLPTFSDLPGLPPGPSFHSELLVGYLGFACLVPPPAAQWRWLGLVPALPHLVFGQIALDGGLRLTVPSALLSAPEATAVSSSDPQHLPGTPGFATPLFSPSLSCCVMPTLPAALSLPFFLLPLIVDVATPLCSQHASWPAPLAGPLQSHPGSSQLHQRTPLAADGPGLS